MATKRLWLSSMTDDAIRKAFALLQPGSRLDALADAARCRAEADWLVRSNATRAATLVSRARAGTDRGDVPGGFRRGGARGKPQGVLYSVGRVQTPTLALLIERERAIRAFVPQDYWELKGDFAAAVSASTSTTTSGGEGPAQTSPRGGARRAARASRPRRSRRRSSGARR